MVTYNCKKQKLTLYNTECEICFKNGPREYPTRAVCVSYNAKRIDTPKVLERKDRFERKPRSDKGKARGPRKKC